MTTCDVRSAIRTSPGRESNLRAIWFAMVAVGRKTASSWPRSSATRRSSPRTVGSSRFCSSPTTASAIARRIPSVGCVMVSERRSITDRSYRHAVDLALLDRTLGDLGQPRYRARQVWEWTARGAPSYEEMTTLPKELRTLLSEEVPFSTLAVVTQQEARDGTVKTLFRTRDGHPLEAVLMRYRDGRRSVCLSSQSGCPLTCTFCATGSMAFGRNLTASEILDQALHFRRVEELDHAVFMGMGEPMLNLDAVLGAA